jgi:D-alanyl-D-alanine-carboxypeptidase/D-alanyl-D-alanine-endopeptidase
VLLAGVALTLPNRTDMAWGRPKFAPAVQGDLPDGDAIDRRVRPLLENHQEVGIVVGVLDKGRARISAYGETALSREVPKPSTAFEIGSITKVFLATLLYSFVDERSLSLETPLKDLLPAEAVVPSQDGREITLEHLASHTSGLPRVPPQDPTWAELSFPLFGGNPYVSLSPESVLESLSRTELMTAPGEQSDYSNFGAMILGMALQRHSGRSFQELVRRRICEPLGMRDTFSGVPPDGKPRPTATGYSALFALGPVRLGFLAEPWVMTPGTEGAGNLCSTVEDMLRFLEANLNAPDGPLGRVLDACHTPRYDAGHGMKVGLGWHWMTVEGLDEPIVWHNGGTGGYSSFMGFVKDSQVGVVVLSNTLNLEGGIDNLGVDILKLLASE